MLSEIKVRTLKANQPPGTLVYTGDNPDLPPVIRLIRYSTQGCEQKAGGRLEAVSLPPLENAVTWLHLQGLQDIGLMFDLFCYFRNIYN